jgi:antitoxin MazE
MRVAKWGNSLAIRIPSAVVETLDLKEGDQVEILPSRSGRELEVVKTPSREELIEGFKEFRGRMPRDFKFNRDEANER